MRVRGDEITTEHELVVKINGQGLRPFPVASVETVRDGRGQRRIIVRCDGLPPLSFAPHSRHTVRSSR